MCAAVSMPRARPEAMTKPSRASSVAICLPDRRAVTRADNGDDGNIGEGEPAFGIKQRRRRIDLGKRRRLARLADGNQACSESIRRLELGLGFGLGAEADVGAASAPRQKRQRVDGGLGAAELIDQSAERGGPDILASDQPKPGDALTMVEPARDFCLGAVLDGPLANARLLASHQALDICGVPNIEKEREQ
jgi:hypothetical protein